MKTTLNSPPKPIIMLDIDDVLCMSSPYGGFDVIKAFAGNHKNTDDILAKLFNLRALNILRRVHDKMNGEVSYVVSSTWRRVFDRESMVRIFNGAGASFIANSLVEGDSWCTPVIDGDEMRAKEIAQWFVTNGCGETFVILDDTFSGKSLMSARSDPGNKWHWRVVLCDEFVGLLDEHFGAIIVALKRPLSMDVTAPKAPSYHP